MTTSSLLPARHSLLPAPQSLQTDGSVLFGRYAGPIANLATEAWDGNGLFSARRFQRKAWLYFGAFSERFMIGFAVVDAGYLGNAFVYVYDRATKQLIEEKASIPFAFPAAFAPHLDARWALSSGARKWSIVPRDGGGWAVGFTGKRLRVSMLFQAGPPGMSTLAPVFKRPFHYTYKVCTLPTEVEVAIDGATSACQASGMLDFTLGYPARHTDWNWASLAGITEHGKTFALNLVAHFTNNIENAYWLDNQIVPLGPSLFQYDATQLERPWQIRDADGQIDFTFYPDGRRSEHLSLGFVASKFTQPFGRFEGTVKVDGRPVKVSGFGVTEEHRAIW